MPSKRFVLVFEDQVQILATMTLDFLWNRMRSEFLQRWGLLQRQGLSDADLAAELEAFMESLSVKPLEDLARQGSGVAYNQGRAAEILTASSAGEVDYVVRSEVLDGNTCEACTRLDGEVFAVGSPEFQEFLPPAKCFGGDRCRGFYVAVPRRMAA